MMIIANLPDSASRLLAIKRIAKISPIPEEDLLNLVKYIDESGRNIIDTQIIELQAPQKFGVASNLSGKALENVNSLLDKSTIFFKEGERVSRMTGLITAFLEHRAKRPNIDALSPEGKLWIANREQDLTFRMTTGSRSFVQSGPMRVPTQWLTFSFRALENIAIGRNFTAGERARMFAIMGPMYGLTGLGVGQLSGYVTESLGYDPSDPDTVKVFNDIKYGFMDQLLSYMIGTETAYAQRVAPVDQIKETYKKLFEESFFTTMFGPSGEISKDIFASSMNGVKAMFGGRTETVREDLTQVLRNISAVDKGLKIKELIETGNYRSRTRKLAVGGLGPRDAAAQFLGATPAAVQNYYDYREMVFKENNQFKKFRNRLQDKANYALRLLTTGDQSDVEKGTKLYEEITDEIWASNFSNALKASLQKSVARGESMVEIMRNALRLGLDYEAQVLQQQMQ